MAKILITGATGFIGSHVAEAFCNQGQACVVLVRNPSRLCAEIANRCEIRRGDVGALESIVLASQDCSSIIHVAGKSSDWGDYDDFYSANVQGTVNVLQACVKNHIDHAIITGSISSYGEEHSANVKDESSPFNSHYPYFLDTQFPSKLNWYRDTKAEATRQAMVFAQNHRIDLTIIEPVWVYGEREFNTGFFTYVKTVQEGLRFLPGSQKNTFHVIYVHDLAKAYVLAFHKRLAGVERIIVGNALPESMHTIFALFCTEAGLRPPVLLPKWAMYPPAIALELYSTLAGSKKKAPLLSRGRVDMFYDSIGYSIQKAQRLLNFSCDYALEQGIKKTVRWYRENGYL